MGFEKAVKHEAKLRLAIAGPSGSGKTYSSLSIATAMGGKIALIDTEHGSASKYADLFDFDVLEIDDPFHPERFIKAMEEAQEAKYNIIVIDSLSHAWNGPGGVLEIKEKFSKQRGYNDYTAWGPAGKIQNDLVQAIVGSNLHVIGTMRSKTHYSVDETVVDGYKKTKITKQGMAPIQRDGFEFEFDVFIDMDIENNGIVTKTRCPELTGGVFKNPGANVANILSTWLNGLPAPEKPPVSKTIASISNGSGTLPTPPLTDKVLFKRKLVERISELGGDVTDPKAALLNIHTAWAVDALDIIAAGRWADGLKLDMTASPEPVQEPV